MSPITGEFKRNALGKGTYKGASIPVNEYGNDPVIAQTNVQSKTQAGYMRMANREYKPLNQVSDGAVFDKASRLTNSPWRGQNYTWHHGKDLGSVFLLDSAIHSAFVPHKGWASEGGVRGEMSDFIDYTNAHVGGLDESVDSSSEGSYESSSDISLMSDD